MARNARLATIFSKPVIPVISDLSKHVDSIQAASCAILQGVRLTQLPDFLKEFDAPALENVELLIHVDLIAGLENNDAGIAFLAQFPRISGVVTVHQQLIAAARKANMLSVLRIFLSDSRALERGLHIIGKSRPDVVDLLPIAAAVKVADLFQGVKPPFITGGLCRSREDVREALSAGSRGVTSTNAELWKLNATGL